jgi:hypothetical protein
MRHRLFRLTTPRSVAVRRCETRSPPRDRKPRAGPRRHRPESGRAGPERGGEAVGVSLSVVRDAGDVLEIAVGDTDVVVFGTDGILAFEHPGHGFTVADGELVADGTVWNGATGAADDDRQLDPDGSTRSPGRKTTAPRAS